MSSKRFRGRRTGLLALLLAAGTIAAAGADPPPGGEAGAPRVSNFRPRTGAANGLAIGLQFWAVVEGSDGVLYFGNSAGVVVHDGIDWRVVELANRSTARSLALGATGTIWVGGQGDLGFLEPSALGEASFVSLVAHVPAEDRSFGDVWKTYTTPSGVFFQTFTHLFHWDGGEMGVVRGRFHFSYLVDGELFVLERDRGLVRLAGKGLELVPGGEAFAGDRLYAVLPLDDERLLVATRERGLFALFRPDHAQGDGGAVELAPASRRFLVEAQIYHGVRLRDGDFAFGTLQSGLVLLDREGRVVRTVDRGNGLLNQTVSYLYPDRSGGLWLALEKGLSRVELPSPVSLFGESEGLDGLPQDAKRYRGRLYVATTHGLLRLTTEPPTDAAAARPRLVPVPGLDAQVWSLLPFEDRLVVASLGGVYELEGERLRQLLPGRASHLYRSKIEPDRLFVALFDGLASLRWSEGAWQDEGRWVGIEDDVRSLVEDDRGRLFLGTAYRSLLRLDLARSTPSAPVAVRLGPEAGWPAEADSLWLFEAGGNLFLASDQGLYRLDAESDRFETDQTLSLPASAPGPAFGMEDPSGNVWIAFRNHLGYAQREDDGSYRYRAAPFARVALDSISALYSEDDGVVWVGSADGLLRYDPTVPSLEVPEPHVLVRRVVDLGAGSSLPAAVSSDAEVAPARFAFEHRSLGFQFSAPALIGEEGAYQTRLAGFDDAWTGWTPETHRDFTNLPPGKFAFSVRARDQVGRVGGATTVPFVIEPPWYRTWPSLLVGLVLVVGGLRLAERRLVERARRRERREAENRRRKEELESARELQLRLLPAAVPRLAYVDVAAYQETATEVGGDYYDFFEQPDESLFVVVGDATGHGFGAGLMVTATKTALLTLREPELRQATAEVNRVLRRVGLEARLNMALGLLHLVPSDGGVELRVSGGGIAPLVILKRDGGCEEVVVGAPPLGAMSAPEFPLIERRLAAGDVVIVMTDGLPETLNPRNEPLGYDRLRIELEALGARYSRLPSGPPEAEQVLADVTAIGESWEQGHGEKTDDLTIVVLRILG